MKGCIGCEKVAAALAGQDPSLVAVLNHSVLLLGDHQAFPGYAVLWSREHCRELHHLKPLQYQGFMQDLRQASAAVEKATACWKLNLASLGNVVQHGHMHLFPRPEDDPQRLRHPWVHEAHFNEPPTREVREIWVKRLREALP